jgi:predicted membrane protein
MYDITKEDIFLLFSLVLAALIGYIVFILSGLLLYGVLAGSSVFFFLIGGVLFFFTETNRNRLLGSFIMAVVIFFDVTMIYGLPAGIIASLSLLVCCLALILLSEE